MIRVGDNLSGTGIKWRVGRADEGNGLENRRATAPRVRIPDPPPAPMPTLKHWLRYDAFGETLCAKRLSRLSGAQNHDIWTGDVTGKRA